MRKAATPDRWARRGLPFWATHPFTTFDLFVAFELWEKVRRIILHQHERFDGRGYPDGLKGQDITSLSRALEVVDAFSAMTEVRTYRQALGPDEVMAEIRKGAGTPYDPWIVEALDELRWQPEVINVEIIYIGIRSLMILCNFSALHAGTKFAILLVGAYEVLSRVLSRGGQDEKIAGVIHADFCVYG